MLNSLGEYQHYINKIASEHEALGDRVNMKVYHGTTESVARRAFSEGIRPRNVSGSSGNWDHSVQSLSLIHI